MTSYPAAPFLAADIAATEAERHAHAINAYMRAAYAAKWILEPNAGPFAQGAAGVIAANAPTAGHPYSDTRPDWRAAHDMALSNADNEPDPLKRAIYQLIRACCAQRIDPAQWAPVIDAKRAAMAAEAQRPQ